MAKSYLLFVLLATLTVIGTATPNLVSSHTRLTPIPITTTELPETNTTTTHSNTTTHAPNTTTTSTTTTSTHAPNTTTTSTTTTPTPAPNTTTTSTTTTSTPAPNTTTTSTTTAAPPTPGPIPAPATGSWVYTDNKNVTCIVLQMALQINVTYLTKDNKTAHTVFNLPVNSTNMTGGSCGNETQTLKLTWMWTDAVFNNLTLQFHKNSTTKRYTINRLDLVIQQDSEHFPNAESNSSMEYSVNGSLFSAPLSSSYQCAHAQKVDLSSVSERNVATLSFSHLREQAFRTGAGHEFSTPFDCEPVDVPDVVPIAVGCGLAALVLVVLAAYLIGRRRSQARGYLSM